MVLEYCKNSHVFDEANTYIYQKTGRKICKTCHRISEKKRLDRNPEAAQRNRERVNAWRKTNPQLARETRQNWLSQLRSLIIEAKAGGCVNCGETNQACLDFHHKHPAKKEFNIGLSLGRFSIKKLQKELPKCIVLCSNCHRKLHAKERAAEES